MCLSSKVMILVAFLIWFIKLKKTLFFSELAAILEVEPVKAVISLDLRTLEIPLTSFIATEFSNSYRVTLCSNALFFSSKILLIINQLSYFPL